MFMILLMTVCVSVLLLLLSILSEPESKGIAVFGSVMGVMGVILMLAIANDFRIERNQLIVSNYDENITLPAKYDDFIDELLVKRYRNSLKD